MRPAALVTGASSGIGKALVSSLAASHDVLAIGRRPVGEIDPPLPPGVVYGTIDQSDPARAGEDLASELDKLGSTALDLAILNAGTGWVAGDDGETPARIRQTLDVNLLGPVAMALALRPRLEAARGTLVLVGSVAHPGSAGFPTYAASKAALNGFGRSLREEWRGRITVQVLHPGPTTTDMHRRAGFDPGRAGRFFIPADAMASMIVAAIRVGKSPVSLSYMAWARRGIAGGAR